MSFNPHDLFAQVEQLADSVDRQFDTMFSSLKGRLETSSWIPDSVRPTVSKVVPISAKPLRRLTYLERAERWVDQHRAVCAAMAAFAGTTAYLVWRGRVRSGRQRKRRARRGAHGAKVEAVVVAGPAASPLTRSLAHDLEKRGFLVYIPVDGAAEEQLVRAEGRDDIRPLHLDLSSPAATSRSITAFTDSLLTVTRSHAVHLAALVVVPALERHADLPIAALSSELWAGALRVHLQRPVDVVRAFLPLLQAQASLVASTNPALATGVVVLSRGITSSLPLAGRSTEAVTHSALAAYLRTLETETPELAISHLQLGAVDLGSYASPRNQLVLHPRSRSSSPPDALSVLGRLGKADMVPARQLHHAVFDAVTGRRTGTTFVGRGARTYAFIGKYTPVEVIRWLASKTAGRGAPEAASAEPTRQNGEEWEELNRSTESLEEAASKIS